MPEYRDIRTGKHRVFIPHARPLFVPSYRHLVFTCAHLDRVEEIMRDVCADFGTRPAESNSEPEHVYLLVKFPPTVAISRLVNSLKGVPSGRLRQEFRTCAATTGEPTGCGPDRASPDRPAVLLSVLRHYIERQNRPL